MHISSHLCTVPILFNFELRTITKPKFKTLIVLPLPTDINVTIALILFSYGMQWNYPIALAALHEYKKALQMIDVFYALLHEYSTILIIYLSLLLFFSPYQCNATEKNIQPVGAIKTPPVVFPQTSLSF